MLEFRDVPSGLNLSAFVTPNPVTLGNSASLNASVSSTSTMSSLSMTYNWGDGSSSNTDTYTFNPSVTYYSPSHAHTYTAAGSYTISVTADAVYAGGGTDSATQTYSVTVNGTSPPPPPSVPPPPTVPAVQISTYSDASEAGAVGLFYVIRTGGDTTQSLTVSYFVSGTATSITDYDALTGTVTFAANATTATISVTAVADYVDDPGEVVTVTLSPGTGYEVVSPAGTQTLDIIDVPRGSIGDTVWLDSDADGVYDTGEQPAANVGVWLLSGGSFLSSTTTGTTGTYQFTNLPAGQYSVHFIVGSGQSLPSSIAGGLNVQLSQGQQYTAADAGILTSGSGSASISGYAWLDDNASGSKETGEQGYESAAVDLYRVQNGSDGGVPIAQTVTDVSGNYSFTGLSAGDYFVTITTPPDAVVLTPVSDKISVTLTAGQASTDNAFGLDKCAPAPTITLAQPTVDGNNIKGNGTYDVAGYEFKSIDLHFVPVAGGRTYSRGLLTAPNGNNWSLDSAGPLGIVIPNGKYNVWAALTVRKNGKDFVYTSKMYKDVEAAQGAGQINSYVTWKDAPTLTKAGANLEIRGKVTVALPANWTVDNIYGFFSRDDAGPGGTVASALTLRRDGATNDYYFGIADANAPNGWRPITTQADGATKFKFQVVAMLKEPGVAARPWSSPIAEANVPT